jgi:ABC-type Zn uptake system ZnuABC Zn-binding protein ZnuA
VPRQPRAFALAALIVAGLVAPSCAPSAPDPEAPPLIVVSVFPIADLTAVVAGTDAAVETLLPSRASIHTWEATPGQVRSLSNAAAYVTVGGGLDGWLEGLADDDPSLLRLTVTDGLTLLRADDHDHGEGGEGTGDPHVWLDPILVRDRILPRITELLVRLRPGQAQAFESRARALADSLTALDQEIRRTLAGSPGGGFIATHEAWHYFADRYGLRSLGSLYEGPGHEPSARGLARLVDLARANDLRAVLAEPQLAETAARALAGEVGARVVVVDPLGGPGLAGRERYLDLMRFNARAFAEALHP